MRSLLLVHGAASGPWVFDGWPESFSDTEVYAVDLHAGLNVAEASMSNYEAAIAAAAGLLPQPVALCGWSMGGLAAMMAARRVEPEALVLLEASPPAEIQGMDESVRLMPGTYEAEEAYGAFPPGMRARPESLLARAERKRGISVPSIPNRTLAVSGREYPDDRGAAIAAHHSAEALTLGDSDHWDLVRGTRARSAVQAWLGASADD